MNLPRLKIRPLSQQSCARFGGVYHNPAAPVGTWYDERNLCSDMYPNAVARRGRTMVQNIDGNTPTVPIVAMCGGDHIVLLDDAGVVYCNGNTLQLYPAGTVEYRWTAETNDARAYCYPSSGSGDSDDGPYEILTWSGNPTRVQFKYMGHDDPDHPGAWEYQEAGQQKQYVILDEELTPPIHWYGYDPDDILEDGGTPIITITLERYASSATKLENASIIRMGSNVIVFPQKALYAEYTPMWFNAVKLASGATMTAADYGYLAYEYLDQYREINLSLCDIDGNSYSGVVVSSTEPAQQGYWLDTGGPTPALREWNYLSAAWIKISSTFVRVNADALNWNEGIRAHDAVQFGFAVADSAGDTVKKLLNSTHYIYAKIDNGDDTYDLVISGILPSDTVTVQADQDNKTLEIARVVPDMDFVVECGNRLWGCRYDEANSINEIYASKLGDPTNWEVYQGLSTDSWRASRGVAAPFTGAAVLDGHPLFFREESLEKVYPSASGAHQIQTFDLEGVEQGAANSLCVIEDRLYYKSPKGVMVYTGSLPRMISGAFGDMVFTGGSGARHQRKYCLSTRKTDSSPSAQNDDGENVVLVYDLYTGDWHIETDAWTGKAITWKDDLYYIYQGSIASMAKGPGYGRIQWWAETAPQAIHDESASRSLTAHKWISYFRLRFRFLSNGTPRMTSELRVYFSYEDGPWELKKRYVHSGADGNLKTFEIAFLPKRKDNFRLRLEGIGPCQIYDIAWKMEKSEAGH